MEKIAELSSELQERQDEIPQAVHHEKNVYRKWSVAAKATHIEERHRLEADLSEAWQSKDSQRFQAKSTEDMIFAMEQGHTKDVIAMNTKMALSRVAGLTKSWNFGQNVKTLSFRGIVHALGEMLYWRTLTNVAYFLGTSFQCLNTALSYQTSYHSSTSTDPNKKRKLET